MIRGENLSNNDEELQNCHQKIESGFKHASIFVSCDVERSFSKYKAVLRDNRKSFQFENLKMQFITHGWYSFQN